MKKDKITEDINLGFCDSLVPAPVKDAKLRFRSKTMDKKSAEKLSLLELYKDDKCGVIKGFE
jgi:hypothetical protein